MAKKQKRHQIEHTTESIDETKIIKSSEQAHIEHTAASETHEQIIKQVSLDVAPEHTESFAFDEKTLPMDTETGPKPIEIQPLFHASYTQAASIIENETRIHSKDTPTQKCSVNVSELTPIVVSQVDETESVTTKQPEKVTASVQLSSTLITSSAAISDQIVPCDNLSALESKPTPAAAVAEFSSIPHESKTVYEQVASQREENLADSYAPDFKQAHATISAQSPIEVHEIDVGESEKDILDKYEPATQSATCSMLSNTALSTQETLAQNVPTKFYPEMIIATEEATPKFVEQIPYQTHETSTSEAENILDLQGIPDARRAHVEFSNLQAITMEQTDISESETISSHGIPSDLMATAKDTISLHKEMQTEFSQAIDSLVSSESVPYTTKTASISVEEMGGKIVETVNVLQSEQPFDTAAPLLGLEASPNYISQEGFTVSEVLVQESDVEFSSSPLAQVKAMQTHEEHKIAEQSDEQLLDTTSDYQHKETEPEFNAQINFELQKSMVHSTTITHDSEKAFDTKLQTSQPQYSIDSNVNNSLMVSEIEAKEDSADFSTEPIAQVEARKTQELYKTYEQTDDQVLDTTGEYRDDEKTPMHNVQITFELQKSTIGESVIAHDTEEAFETKLKTNEPHYTSEADVKSSVMVSETQPQEISGKFSPETVVSTTAIATQESFRAPESSKDQIFETTVDHQLHEKQPEHIAQINFELQRSMMSETVTAHDAEQAFEKAKQMGNRPQYSMTSPMNAPILVSETQTIESESSLGVKPTEDQYLTITDSPNQLARIGAVAETIPYDSTEPMASGLEKGVSAKQEPIMFHEVTVEMSTVTEPLDELDAQKLDEQKNATPGVVTKSALNVTMEESAEALGKFEITATKEQLPDVKHDLAPVHSIIVDETHPEHSTYLDIDTLKTATANVSTIDHSAAKIDENWPMETSKEFKSAAATAEQNLIQNIVESTAIEASTVITSDTIKEFEDQMEKPTKPKYSINEMRGILTEDIISQENAESNRFTLVQDAATGHIVHDVEVQHRCEQSEQTTVENIDSLEPIKSEQTVSSTKNVSDALTTARVEEVITSLSGSAFEEDKPMQQHGKIVQETFNVVGQSAQHIPLESEVALSPESTAREEYPKKSIEGRASYATSQIDLFERESELKAHEQSEMHSVKTSTEQFLTVANTLEETTLASVEFDMSTDKAPLKTAVTKVERLLESIHTEDSIANEMSSDIQTTAPKTVTAKTTHESKKSVQVEKIGIFESEDKLVPRTFEPKICDQTLEDHLKAATTQVTQIIEQTSVQPEHKVQSKIATEFASEIDQNITFESVYLEAHRDINESAHISDTPTHAVKVIEQFPLYKENTFDDKHIENLLIKPLIATQEPTELTSAYQESEINTIVNIKTDKKDDRITNKKKTKKLIETARSIEVEGRCLN